VDIVEKVFKVRQAQSQGPFKIIVCE